MRNRIGSRAGVVLALCATLAGGCGGGGASLAPQAPSEQNAQRGAVALDLQFASIPVSRAASGKAGISRTPVSRAVYAGNIPYGALSVRVTVTNPVTGAVLAPARTITSPVDVNGLKPLITVQYPALPVGPLRVDVAAFPNDNATGNILATGGVTGQIVGAQTTTLSAPMALTIVKITANPSPINLAVDGGRATITVTGMDGGGQPLDLPYMFVPNDPDMVSVTVDPQHGGVATIVSANIRGTTRITAYDPNSGLSVIIPIAIEVL